MVRSLFRQIASNAFPRLFHNCVFAILRMLLFNLPSAALSVTTTKPNQENQKRLERFRAFYEHPSTPSYVRRASLCLQLTQYALNLSAKRSLSSEPELPMLVHLGKGVVQRRTSEHLVHLIPRLRLDGAVETAETVVALMTTIAHLIIRFQQYLAASLLFPNIVFENAASQILNP